MALGTLFVAATPIGNLEDISLRALRVMREADYILCEDTRVTKILLNKYEIKTPTISYHQHSKEAKIFQILRYLKEGKNLVLVSDAGTPGISDPGSFLIAAILAEYGDKIKIISLPGPSALISALSISGWDINRFTFFGFLPHKKGREKMLNDIINSFYPVVFYESKHRLIKCLQEIINLKNKAGKKIDMILVREITKIFESVYRGSPEELLNLLTKDINKQKGEFVVLLREIK